MTAPYPSSHLSSMMMGRFGPSSIAGNSPTEGPGTGTAGMEQFRILEHTADVGFEAFGSTRQEAFVNAARALIYLIVDLEAIDAHEAVSVQVQGTDPESLLVNWLSELLYLHDAEGWLFRDFEILSLQEDSLSALARGEKFHSARHQAKLLVKAITYHQLALERTPEGWRAQVYVDI
jgi:SHS2 domain-containing protein